MSSPLKYILFTKTNWAEQPRIRHQFACLLASNKHEVIFFEKPDFFYNRRRESKKISSKETITLKRTRQLIHHQLRISRILRLINCCFEKREILNNLTAEEISCSVIINFNYDYYFLRDLFPINKIITLINDDFQAQAKLNKGRHVLNSLEEGCNNSDAVFVVSYPLAKQLENWCAPQIFFPWALSRYKRPNDVTTRDSILIWAHIDRRFDFELLKKIGTKRPEIRIDFFGPVSSKVAAEVSVLSRRYNQFNFYSSVELSQIDFDKYFCSAIPYLKNIKDIDAVSVSNKTFQLLSMGMPIITHGMPNFIENEAIFKTNCIESFIAAIDACLSGFYDLQVPIEILVSQNQAENRYKQILSVSKS